MLRLHVRHSPKGDAGRLRQLLQKRRNDAQSASSSSSLAAGMAYEFDSQRFRSTSRQRSEQNGREASMAGLPQIGSGLPETLAGPASSGGLVGIQPAEANRETFAAEQRDRLIERQADDIAVGAAHLDHDRSGDALHRIAAGLAAPFAGADIGLDVVLVQP